MIAVPPGAAEVVLALADDEHVIGARHTSWIGVGPFLEEDLAFCSIAQDELGHAIALYELLTDEVDRFALLRDPDAYRSSWLCEWPCTDWADALVRHVLYDHAEAVRWDAFATSSWDALRTVATWAQREEAFHVAHGDALLGRVLDAGGDARARVVDATTRLLPIATAVFEPVATEPEALASGIVARSSSELANEWWARVAQRYGAHGVTLERPAPITGQHARTARSEHFAALQSEIRRVIDLDPAATW